MTSEGGSERPFLAASTLLFVAAAVATIIWCRSMSSMGGMVMPGGSSMSMVAMCMPRQGRAAAAASFLGAWTVMMIAMMLPSLVPMLQRYRKAVRMRGERRLGRLTALVGAGYFLVWVMVGAAVFPLDAALAAVPMQGPALTQAVPVLVGIVVLAAGAFQFTGWKARTLICWRDCLEDEVPLGQPGAALRYGVRLGVHCGYCCANLMAILLAAGVMNLDAMVLVAAMITIERLTPDGKHVARAIGTAAIATGVVLVVRAVAFG